jgi:hypothetical protein
VNIIENTGGRKPSYVWSNKFLTRLPSPCNGKITVCSRSGIEKTEYIYAKE